MWSLGIILFIMLNSSMPFDDSNLRKLLKDQMSRNFVFRSRVRDSVSTLAKSLVSLVLNVILLCISGTIFLVLRLLLRNHHYPKDCSVIHSAYISKLC